jgi:hypothetical protein
MAIIASSIRTKTDGDRSLGFGRGAIEPDSQWGEQRGVERPFDPCNCYNGSVILTGYEDSGWRDDCVPEGLGSPAPDREPGAPYNRDDPHGPLCSEAGPPPIEALGALRSRQSAGPALFGSRTAGRDGPYAGLEPETAGREIAWFDAAGSGSGRRGEPQPIVKRCVVSFALSVLQVFRISNAYIHFPHRLGTGGASVSSDSRPENG